jgi:hypothetical protein
MGLLRAAAVLALSATLFGTGLNSDRVIRIRPGTHSFDQVLKKSGKAGHPIRYQPEQPGTVTIKGGEIRRMHDIILDGVLIDGRLDPEWPAKSRGVDVRQSTNVTIMNSEIVGPADIHTGYDVTDTVNCSEARGFPTQSGGVGSDRDSDHITFSNVTVHGFRGAGSLRGKHDRIEASLFRNNFNGFSVSSADFQMVDSVMWVHPNHLLSMQGAGTVLLANNLFVDGQDMFQAGKTWKGAAEVTIVSNTFYIPANKPCYGFTGMNLYQIAKSAVVRDNIFVNKHDGFMAVSDQSIGKIQSDYNLFFNYESTTREFHLIDRGTKVSYEDWRQLSDQDGHSIVRQPPAFVDAPQYADADANKWGFRIPASVAEARSWFVLQASSPGKGAASDGDDIGIRATPAKLPER